MQIIFIHLQENYYKMKDKILNIIKEVSINNKCPEHATREIMELIGVENIEELRRLAYEGLPSECVAGYDEVKFCHHRQGDGNMCKHCSDYL